MYKMPLIQFSFAVVLAAVVLVPACEKPLEGPNAIKDNADIEAGAPEAEHSLRVETAADAKPARSMEKGIAGGPIIMWSDPAPKKTGSTRGRKTDDQFEFKMNVVTQQPVKTTDIKVKVNGVLLEGARLNEEDLSPSLSPQRRGSHHLDKFPGRQYG